MVASKSRHCAVSSRTGFPVLNIGQLFFYLTDFMVINIHLLGVDSDLSTPTQATSGRTQLNGKAPSSSTAHWRRGRRISVLLDRYDTMAASVFHPCGKVVGGTRRLLEGRFAIRASSSSSSCRNCLPSSTFHRRGQHGSHPTCGHELLVSNHSDRKTR